jgi:16S rRNA (guanine(966)-N(2))-methyltransferase RsmD
MRLTGGSLSGRTLSVPRRGVRPTADRVRESLFATLSDLEDLVALDLYAGTGALGIEALSRGVRSVVFVDNARQSIATLSRNLKTLELAARTTVLRSDAVRALKRLGREPTRFDLVFADPPYASDELPRVLPALLAAKVLAADARVVVERDRRVPLAPVAGLTLEDERIYGETAIMRFSASG